MDYFQGAVTEYLRANRSTFVNTECLIQLKPGDSPANGEHWYCDAVAVNFQEKAAYLCEVTYSRTLQYLFTRLGSWINNWAGIESALARDCGIGPDWKVRPWIFIPAERGRSFDAKFADLLQGRSVKAADFALGYEVGRARPSLGGEDAM
jgi:hypothetical protein